MVKQLYWLKTHFSGGSKFRDQWSRAIDEESMRENAGQGLETRLKVSRQNGLEQGYQVGKDYTRGPRSGGTRSRVKARRD